MNPQKLIAITRHKVVENIAALTGVQVVNYILPLIVVPYLARVLNPEGWGLVAFAQSFAGYIILVVEYGFGYSASREVAVHRDAPDFLSDLFADVTGAKCVLGMVGIAVGVAAYFMVPEFYEIKVLLLATIFYALAQGGSPLWYFQGVERMRTVAVLEGLAKVLAVIGVITFVKAPGDEWKVLALYGLGTAVSTGVAYFIAYQEVQLRLPKWNRIQNVLKMGSSMFVFRISVSLYTVGNAFILGLFVSPTLVGYYAGAEKISKACVGLLMPVSRALYPRFSDLVHRDIARAARLARLNTYFLAGAGALMGIGLFVSAPSLIQLMLGESYVEAVPVLQILSALPLLIAISNVLGVQWMLPLRFDRAFNKVIIGSGIANLLLALLLAPRLAHIGMAIAVVIAEIGVSAGFFISLRARQVDPFCNDKLLIENMALRGSH